MTCVQDHTIGNCIRKKTLPVGIQCLKGTKANMYLENFSAAAQLGYRVLHIKISVKSAGVLNYRSTSAVCNVKLKAYKQEIA